jgi:Asp-tRNA(Asn)/Glu-tRNA(Gln) amidotransferase B subunit
MSAPNRALVIKTDSGVMGLIMPIFVSEDYIGGAKTIFESPLTAKEINNQVEFDLKAIQKRKDKKQAQLSTARDEVRKAKSIKDLSAANWEVEYLTKELEEINAEIEAKKSEFIDNPIQEQQDLETVKTAIKNGEITEAEATEYIAKPTKRSRKVAQSIEDIESKAESESEAELNEVVAEPISESPFPALDAALEMKGPKATEAREALKEKFGKEKYKKMVEITKNFEKIIDGLVADGRLVKDCP